MHHRNRYQPNLHANHFSLDGFRQYGHIYLECCKFRHQCSTKYIHGHNFCQPYHNKGNTICMDCNVPKFGIDQVASSETWLFYNAGSQTTYAPFPAQLVNPTSGSTVQMDIANEVLLEWSGADVDNDIESFEVFSLKPTRRLPLWELQIHLLWRYRLVSHLEPSIIGK